MVTNSRTRVLGRASLELDEHQGTTPFSKCPSQDQASWLILVVLFCCHMLHSLTNGPNNPSDIQHTPTSHISPGISRTSHTHSPKPFPGPVMKQRQAERCQSKVMPKGNLILQHLPHVEGTESRNHLLWQRICTDALHMSITRGYE